VVVAPTISSAITRIPQIILVPTEGVTPATVIVSHVATKLVAFVVATVCGFAKIPVLKVPELEI